MLLKGIVKKVEGKFTALYDLIYENKLGSEKVYEMISYDKNLTLESNIYERSANSVVLMVFNRDKTKILLNKEFRLAVNHIVYNTPAGLIDKGEDYIEAAKRELKEETGLDIIEIIKVLPPCLSAVGLSNDKNICIFCIADGNINSEKSGEDEEIEPIWVDKKEALSILEDSSGFIAARTQMLLYFWINWREENNGI